MAFNDLLLQVGGVGRFQKIQVTLVILPVILMASHNTLHRSQSEAFSGLWLAFPMKPILY